MARCRPTQERSRNVAVANNDKMIEARDQRSGGKDQARGLRHAKGERGEQDESDDIRLSAHRRGRDCLRDCASVASKMEIDLSRITARELRLEFCTVLATVQCDYM